MKIIKKINNNVALAQDDDGRNLVAFGKGIGFPQMPYELNDLSKVERTFYDVKKEHIVMFDEADEKVMSIAVNIVDYARSHVNKNIGDYLYYVLVDHINFAIERYRNKVYVPMKLSNEIKFNYDAEYQVGDWAWRCINKEFDVNLPKDERSIIAMHIVESEESSHHSQRETSFEQIADHVMKIISEDLNIEIDRNEFNAYRFETHLKYLYQRIDDQPLNSENVEMFEVVKEKYPQVYMCTEDVSEYLKMQTGMEINEEEMLYLMLHINRLMDRNK
ncbi:MAG: PRD domain-containing protein [Erysipelotrichaceae bacterium]|nr:PRD domain-containing protein [Erysipelotrichaceae bacterium]